MWVQLLEGIRLLESVLLLERITFLGGQTQDKEKAMQMVKCHAGVRWQEVELWELEGVRLCEGVRFHV